MPKQQAKRLRGKHRTGAILGVVQTDNTFVHHVSMMGSWWVGRCLHCNSAIVVEDDGQTNATVEHIIPITAGGSVCDLQNLALACERCNNQKGIEHDRHVGKGGRADEVVEALKAKRMLRWRAE